MTRDLCPNCGQELPTTGGHLTPRELDVLTCWWMVGTVKAAAHMAGVGEQRAKNMLSRARSRNRVDSNQSLLTLHFVAVRKHAADRISHNLSHEAAA